jgi:uncharacterized protein
MYIPLFQFVKRVIFIVFSLIATYWSLAQGPATYPPGSKILSMDSLTTINFFNVIRSGSDTALAGLLRQGVDPNSTLTGYSALMAATLYGTSSQMKILIEQGAKVNYQDNDGITALWLAVPDWDKTMLLLEHGADPSLRSREGYCVLVKLANIPGSTGLFQLLVSRGADLRKCCQDNSVVYNAASSCDSTLLGYLLKSGLSPNDPIRSGDVPINNALNYRCFQTIKFLADHGANVNNVSSGSDLDALNGLTPLMYSAISNDSLSFYYLLDHGANVEARTGKGYTVLMLLQMAETDSPAMTLALIRHGANPMAKSKNGTDALSLAIAKGNTASVAILKGLNNK